ICASAKWPMRHFAITGIVTASWISRIFSGSDMRATPPCALVSAGTRSSAMTATAPASSATFACSASTTSMITPPLSISARPLFTRIVPISCIGSMLAALLARAARRRLRLRLLERPHVRAGGVQVGARAVPELDADHRAGLLADDQAVGVDDRALLVVRAVLPPRGEHPVADAIRVVHGAIIRARQPARYAARVADPEHPAAKAGRLVRAVGLGIARELEKRAQAAPAAR